MQNNNLMDQIKQLRGETGAGVMDAKRALEEASGDMDQARKLIQKRGYARAAKKADRATREGVVYAYIHHDGKSGAMVELTCETDFVGRTDEFKNLAKELAMQVTSMDPVDVANFLEQPYIRDPKITVKELMDGVMAKLGENIRLVRFVRYGLGEANE